MQDWPVLPNFAIIVSSDSSLVDHRAHINSRLKPRPSLKLRYLRTEKLNELSINTLLDINTVGCNAGLAGVAELRDHRLPHSHFQIAILKHQHWSQSAQLQTKRLDTLCRLRHPAGHAAVLAAHRHLLAQFRLLPAGAVGRLRRTVRVRRARPGPGRCPAPPEGRMSRALPAGPPGLSVARRVEVTDIPDALHAEWTKLRTGGGSAWLLAGTIAATVAVSAAATAAARCPSGTACPVDTTKLSLTGIEFGQ